MTRNEQLAYLRRRRHVLEGFREPTKGSRLAHATVCGQILALLQEDQDG